MQEVVRGERNDVVERLVTEELRPVVREAITEDVLRGIADLVALTPHVVEALRDDLLNGDTGTRQKAAALVAKYTLGHPAIVTKDDDPSGKQLVVNFELPRPEEEEPVEVKTTTLRECDLCHEHKPESDFADGSDRCIQCWHDQRARVLAKFGADAD